MAALRNHISVGHISIFVAASLRTFLVAMVSPLAGLASRYLFSAPHGPASVAALDRSAFNTAGVAQDSAPERAAAPAIQRTIPILAGWPASARCGSGISPLCVPHPCAAPASSMSSKRRCSSPATAFWWPIFSPNFSIDCKRPRRRCICSAAASDARCLGSISPFRRSPSVPFTTPQPAQLQILQLIHGQWGITHEMDQQLGGLLMWVPAAWSTSVRSWPGFHRGIDHRIKLTLIRRPLPRSKRYDIEFTFRKPG